MTENPTPPSVSIPIASALMCVRLATVYEWTRTGRLPLTDPHGRQARRRIPLTAIEALGYSVTPDAIAQAERIFKDEQRRCTDRTRQKILAGRYSERQRGNFPPTRP